MSMAYANPTKLGLNTDVLKEMIEMLQEKAELHSITVCYRGDIVLEGAWAPFTLTDPQMMHSLSKIGTSLSLGFAVNEGKIRLEDHFLDYVKEDLPEKYDPVLEKITVYDLLTMQAGSPFCCNNVWFTRLEKNWETHWLQQSKLTEDVGKAFHYDSGCSYTLSRIVTKVMGENCLSIMQKRVFDRIGLGKINWLESPEGHNTGGWGMYLTSRDIAALAQLLIQKGKWNGEQIIPEEWIDEMTKMRVAIPGAEQVALSHYAYHIKAGKEIFAAEGAFGQYLIGFRDYPVAIGITAGTPDYVAADICLKYLKKAIASGPVSVDKADTSEKQLANIVNSLALPMAKGKEKHPSAEALALLENPITFTDNPRKINSLLLRQEEDCLRMYLEIDGEKKEACAGYRCWKRNDIYPGDYRMTMQAMSYAFAGNSLEIVVGLLNTSYRETYRLTIKNGIIKGTWQPNVTYLEGNKEGIWHFTGIIS